MGEADGILVLILLSSHLGQITDCPKPSFPTGFPQNGCMCTEHTGQVWAPPTRFPHPPQ
ncbi:hypothetical protein PF005_g6571 [Phytophthora fragariae]|nr:hypothetical protein PF003_g38240 [Phytophthora fragariae]KAE9045141.1 hypothetical protein PR001_g5084 [Phytophthora rubi]KAE8946970.1 hypothetical protein PF009_g3414 [Phytophthora fragariae]KAE9045478.1 hypothetical protein PR002_g2207 [Phytophthora rubi]KAE9124288.1 hypothetical protein PF007_g6780 [Phytophthora fragariae]